MARIVVSTFIRAPLERVFLFLADGENAPRWHPSIVEARRIGGTQLGAGSTVRYRARVGPLDLVWVARAVVFERNRGFRDTLVRAEKGPLKSYELTGRFSEEGGGARVHMELSYTLGWGPLGRLLDALVVSRRVRRHFEEGLRRAKELLERGLDPARMVVGSK